MNILNRDVIRLITLKLPLKQQYQVRRISKLWNSALTNLNWPKFVESHGFKFNWLLFVIFKFPTKKWDWYDISENPYITWELVQSYPDLPWDWHGLSGNPNLTWDQFKPFNNYNKWAWDAVFKHPNVTWENILYVFHAVENICPTFRDDHPELFKDEMYSVTLNPNITTEIIEQNPNYPWAYSAMYTKNPTIKREEQKKYMNVYVSDNPFITIDYIQNNMNKVPQSFWRNVSSHRALTWDFIQKNPHLPWDITGISRNPNITWEIVQNNPDIPWEFYYISENPNITCEIIQNNPNRPWRWDAVSMNPSITFKFVQPNMDKPWDWTQLTRNHSMTLEIIANNPNYPWDWRYVPMKLK